MTQQQLLHVSVCRVSGPNTQLCRMCLTVKPLTAFSKDKTTANDHLSYCRRCDRIKHQLWASDLHSRMKQRFYKQQNGLCPVCGRTIDLTQTGSGASTPVLDHPHSAEAMHSVQTLAAAMTGLLHNNCNKAIGLFADNPAALRRAAHYIEHTRGDRQQQLDV